MLVEAVGLLQIVFLCFLFDEFLRNNDKADFQYNFYARRKWNICSLFLLKCQTNKILIII